MNNNNNNIKKIQKSTFYNTMMYITIIISIAITLLQAIITILVTTIITRIYKIFKFVIISDYGINLIFKPLNLFLEINELWTSNLGT